MKEKKLSLEGLLGFQLLGFQIYKAAAKAKVFLKKISLELTWRPEESQKMYI